MRGFRDSSYSALLIPLPPVLLDAAEVLAAILLKLRLQSCRTPQYLGEPQTDCSW